MLTHQVAIRTTASPNNVTARAPIIPPAAQPKASGTTIAQGTTACQMNTPTEALEITRLRRVPRAAAVEGECPCSETSAQIRKTP